MNNHLPPAYMLAGGKSRRFGSDKARAQIDGSPMLRRLHDALTNSGHHVHVVAQDPHAYADLGLHALTDLRPGQCGPMAGLEAALHHHLTTQGAGWLLLLSCDLTDWQPLWCQELMRHAQDDLHSVFSQEDSGRLHPLPGLFHSRLLTPLTTALDQGSRRLTDFLQSEPHTLVRAPDHGYPQANTPEQLRARCCDSQNSKN